jgi:DNA modification methylase
MKDMEIELNKVYNVDVMELLKKIPNNYINLVFSDIDYNVGLTYNNKSYTKPFDIYIDNYINLAKECHRVLRNDGNSFFINYAKNNAFLWVRYLNDTFYDVQEYVWIYNSNIGHSPTRFTTAHRTILHCRKTKNSVFYKENVTQPYKNMNDKRIQARIAAGHKGRAPYSWFYADLVKNVSKNSKGIEHPCVIPEKVSSLLIKSVTKPEDIVLILFAGSGSEIEVCKKLKRNFISADIDQSYCEYIDSMLYKDSLNVKEL